MRNFLFILIVFISGCATGPTTERFDENCRSWIGKPTSSLVSAWGIPSNEYKIDTNTKLIEYGFQNGGAVMPAPIGYAIINSSCKVTFTSTDDVISNYKWQGNSCRSQ